MSLILPPWRRLDSTRQTSPAVEHQVHAEIPALAMCVATPGVPVHKQAVDKVRKHLAGVSALVDVWWQGVWRDVQPMARTPLWRP